MSYAKRSARTPRCAAALVWFMGAKPPDEPVKEAYGTYMGQWGWHMLKRRGEPPHCCFSISRCNHRDIFGLPRLQRSKISQLWLNKAQVLLKTMALPCGISSSLFT